MGNVNKHNIILQTIMAPFGQGIAQSFLDSIKNGTIPNGNALIMVSDDMIVSESLFDKPLIISQVTFADANSLFAYSFNANQSLTSRLEHTFIANCFILNPVTPTYLVLSALWVLVGVIWYITAFWLFKTHSLFLQRVLMIIPVCKFLETMINGFFYNACPWLGAQNPSEKYLEMARISIITIVYTVMLALLYIMSKGW